MSDLMLKASPELAKSLLSPNSREASAVVALIAAYKARLGAPTGQSGEPATYFSVQDVEAGTGEDLAKALRALPGIEAAYVKPSDAMP